MSFDNTNSNIRRRGTIELTSVMMNQIVDESLMQRYGTSLQVNMGREYQKYLDEKYTTLRKEFDKINKDLDEGIDTNELTEFLNTYSKETGKIFSHEYCATLFDLMDKDKSGKISIQEFVTTYIVLEEKIRFKQIRLQKAYDELSQTREKYYKGMIENQNEKLNNENIAENAFINISVLEAKDLKPLDFRGKSDPFVVLILDDKKEKSTYKSDTLDPVWNEDFVFSVKSKHSILKIEIYDKETIGSKDLEGLVKIPLMTLLDQKKIDNWYDLENSDGNEEKGRIRLRLQLIWSKYHYYQDNMNRTDDKLKKIKSDMEELNQYLDLFAKPFGILLYVEIDDRVSKIMWGDTEEILPHNTLGRRSVGSPQHRKDGLAGTIENVFRGTFSKILDKNR